MEHKKEHFFANRIHELAERAYVGEYPVFTDFLTTKEYMIVTQCQKDMRGVSLMFWGGHEDCSHVMAGFFPLDWFNRTIDAFPIVCIRVVPQDKRYAQTLSHRDYLGAILNLGIERAVIGDIRICDQTAFVFCKRDFASFVVENFTTVKHTLVNCEIMHSLEQIPPQQYKELSHSVASLRLDNVVSAMTGLSRGKASDLIRQGLVIAGHEERTSVSFTCRDNMIITIRKYGKYRLRVLEDAVTRKGKQKIIIYKFI